MKSTTHKAKGDGVLGTVVHSIESAFDTVAKKTGLASKPARRRRKAGKTSKASAKKSRGTAKGKGGVHGKSRRSKR